ncbi:MAG: DUF6504 family protein [bacterium]
MRLVNRPLTVRTAAGLPRVFTWQGRELCVDAVRDVWADTGEWWRGEPEKIFYRVSAGGGLYEVYFEPASASWVLYKIYD